MTEPYVDGPTSKLGEALAIAAGTVLAAIIGGSVLYAAYSVIRALS